MLATIIISLLIALAVVFAIRSIIKSRASGGCDSCPSSCSKCTGHDIVDSNKDSFI